MPQKKQQKKQIVRIFQAAKFWRYTPSPQQITEKAAAFLTTYQKQLAQLISQEKSLEQNFEVLCDKIGIAVHPCVQNLPKEQSKFPELRNTQYGARVLKIVNFKIDAITLKLLSFLITHYKLNTLKLSRNQLNIEAEQLKKLIEKQNSSSTLFLQWNPLIEIPNRRDIFIATVKPSIQHLLLRQDKLGNQICSQLIQKIKDTPTIALKSLDLTGNQLTVEISAILCKFIEEEKNLQFLGLSKNKLNGNEFLTKLFGTIGQVPVTEQDYAKHLETMKTKDEIVEKNKKKKKGAVDQPLPFIFQLRENEKGRFFVKNTSLQNLNLAKNGINDSSVPLMKSFAENQGRNVQVFLDCNKFSKKSKDTLQQYQNLLF